MLHATGVLFQRWVSWKRPAVDDMYAAGGWPKSSQPSDFSTTWLELYVDYLQSMGKQFPLKKGDLNVLNLFEDYSARNPLVLTQILYLVEQLKYFKCALKQLPL